MSKIQVQLTRAQIEAYRTQCCETLQHAIRDMAPPASGTIAAIVESMQALDCLVAMDDGPAPIYEGEPLQVTYTQGETSGICDLMRSGTVELGTIPAGAVVTDDTIRELWSESVEGQAKTLRKRKGKE